MTKNPATPQGAAAAVGDAKTDAGTNESAAGGTGKTTRSYGEWFAWLFTPQPKPEAAGAPPEARAAMVAPEPVVTKPTEFILHHHDPSPFAEKIRKAFGVKGLSWKSVQIPMVMPKPDLTVLTGGYRGTPVLQIGADVYCDSRLIIAEIERRFPLPELLRAGPIVSFGLQHWTDEAMFSPGASLAMHENAEQLPGDLLEDREAYFKHLNFAAFGTDAVHFRSQLRGHSRLIEDQLRDGRAFIFGERPQWTDINAYFPIWMLGGHVPSNASILDGLPRLAAWRARMDELGQGKRHDIEAQEAIDRARDETPAEIASPTGDTHTGIAVGDAVTITPVGHEDTPITGVLATADDRRIVLHRTDDRTGAVAVHFPRIGYRLERAG